MLEMLQTAMQSRRLRVSPTIFIFLFSAELDSVARWCKHERASTKNRSLHSSKCVGKNWKARRRSS